ncbi:MAG: tripartite tricarboxylate transporter substrate binding protein, partial [Rubritepida sp.]|nr:tripartite tricarboxylate transporter substrate binding protein [Rubritepida sp.]
AVVARQNEVYSQALRAPEDAARLPGARIIAADPAGTMRFMAEEQTRWAEVVRAANIRIE